MSANQVQNVDNFDNLVDLSDFDTMTTTSFPSPSLSPSSAGKNQFPNRPTVTTVQAPTNITAAATQPTMSGPSHQYELYKQQTGIVPGALASTLAVNQATSQMAGYNSGFSMDMMGMSPETELFDFNSAPNTQGSSHFDMEMDFDSPGADSSMFFPGTDSTINPSAIGGGESPAQQSNVGRLWPGMHTQAAAIAKAQAQHRQQQQQQQQQVLHTQQRPQPPQQQAPPQQPLPTNKPRAKSVQPSDPIVEQKITQLLNSMRAKSNDESGSPVPLMNVPRPKKDEEDMDEDERLLASEEGKKLSSKERRQLRNKVSARAFRSRRKEYISQLEAEIATKVTENGDLRMQNRALADENKRLTDLTRMLLSSSSFSSFLDNLSTDPSQQAMASQQELSVKTEQAQTEQQQQQQQQQQLAKDANPYVTQQTQQQPQSQHMIGMARIPEQNVDLSMFNNPGSNSAFSLQPQVFAVTETPETPASIATDILSGKTSNFVGEALDSDEDKMDLPAVEAPKSVSPQLSSKPEEESEEVWDDDFENDPEFALYHAAPRSETCPAPVDLDDAEDVSFKDIFGGVESEKMLERYELVDAAQHEQASLAAATRVQLMCARLDHAVARLEDLCL